MGSTRARGVDGSVGSVGAIGIGGSVGCAVCGSRELHTDAVEPPDGGAWLWLAECARCAHRWTRALSPLAAARVAPERSEVASAA